MSKLTAEWEKTAQRLAKKAPKDARLFNQLLQGVLSNQDETRFTSFMALMHIADEHPELLYPHWDRFASLID